MGFTEGGVLAEVKPVITIFIWYCTLPMVTPPHLAKVALCQMISNSGLMGEHSVKVKAS